MSNYKVVVSNNSIKVDTSAPKHETKVDTTEYGVSLSRVGGQGSKGDSVSNVEINSNNEIIITITGSSGDVVETYNLGQVGQNTKLGELEDVDLSTVSDNDFVQYDLASDTYKPHTLTTTSVTDIDNTGKSDGAMLLFDGTSSKYKATVNIDNGNTFLKGGSY